MRTDLGDYGTIEHAAIVPEKRCAFVSFTTIQAAIKAVMQLPTKPAYRNLRVSYGKDNCTRPAKGMAPGPGSGQVAPGYGRREETGLARPRRMPRRRPTPLWGRSR